LQFGQNRGSDFEVVFLANIPANPERSRDGITLQFTDRDRGLTAAPTLFQHSLPGARFPVNGTRP
jgi:hypothetical protein